MREKCLRLISPTVHRSGEDFVEHDGFEGAVGRGEHGRHLSGGVGGLSGRLLLIVGAGSVSAVKAAQRVIELLLNLAIELLVRLLHSLAQVGDFLVEFLRRRRRSARRRARRPTRDAAARRAAAGPASRSRGGCGGLAGLARSAAAASSFVRILSASDSRGGAAALGSSISTTISSRAAGCRVGGSAGTAAWGGFGCCPARRKNSSTCARSGSAAGGTPAAASACAGWAAARQLADAPLAPPASLFASLIWRITQNTKTNSPARTLTIVVQPSREQNWQRVGHGQCVRATAEHGVLRGTSHVDRFSVSPVFSLSLVYFRPGPLAVAIAPRMSVSACTLRSL